MSAALRPNSLTELTAAIGRFDGRIAYVAGGTDLIIAQAGADWPDLLIDVTGIAGLDGIEVEGDSVHIGAAATMTALSAHSVLQDGYTAMTQAAASIGSVQIRNRATIGGNIASAMPAGDLLPVLRCLEARIEVQRRDGGVDALDFDRVITGRGETCLGAGDLITAVILPRRPSLSAFVKFGPRDVLTIAKLNIAACADLDPQTGCVTDARVVAGALAPVPLRMATVEAALQGRAIDQVMADGVLNALSQAVDAAIPGRASQPYKRRAIVGLGLDLLQHLFDREFDIPADRAVPA